MYKTESILGLTGSIIGAIFTFLFLLGALLLIFFFGAIEPFVHTVYDNWAATHIVSYGFTYDTFTAFVIPFIAICSAAAFVIAAASVILGFIGTAKLNRDDKSGGALLIVGGALALISVVGFIPFVLLLVGGIMAVSRKPAAAAQPEINKAV